MYENAAEILVVFLDSMIELLDLRLGKETQHALLELPRSLARYDLHQSNLLPHGFGYDPVFRVPELGLCAAELDPGQKNRRSHRGQALASLRAQLVARENQSGPA